LYSPLTEALGRVAAASGWGMIEARGHFLGASNLKKINVEIGGRPSAG
jgi:hypothetical protein